MKRSVWLCGALLCAVALGCSSLASERDLAVGRGTDAGAREGMRNAADSVDVEESVSGVLDEGRDPSVLALRIRGVVLCSATLIASDVVLTARHCVAPTLPRIQCPASHAQTGEPFAAGDVEVVPGTGLSAGEEALARGTRIFVPEGHGLCDADIAVLLLDAVVPNVRPLPLAASAVQAEARVRTVGFGVPGEGLEEGARRMREHVRVLAAGSHEFSVAEATCQGESGGPAIDQTTGAVLGVLSRGGPSGVGAGAHNVYTQVAAFLSLVEEAKNASELSKKSRKPAPSKPPSDVGKLCARGADCATGLCVNPGAAGYCSRTCGGGDRCPAGYHCGSVQDRRACTLAK